MRLYTAGGWQSLGQTQSMSEWNQTRQTYYSRQRLKNN
jgi:hypothetical protein